MAYRLTPLPLAADEPAQAYACRLARRINLPLRFWCTDVGLSRNDVINGTPEAVQQIADYGGVDATRLRAATIRLREARNYELNGQALTRETLRRTRLRGCLQCMKEQMNGGAVWDVSIQTAWCLASIFTCPIHNTALVEIGVGKNAMFNEWSLLTEDFLTSEAADVHPAERPPGEFELYLMERVLHGTTGGGGEVDDLPMHVAMRLGPFIGQTLLKGTGAQEPSTDEEMIKAADTGFRALRPIGGLEKTLADIDRGAGPRKFNQGPQHRLGRFLYSFLSSVTLNPAYEPTLARVREFILDTIPVDRGTILLGQTVEACRTHSVATLQAITGMHPATLRRYLSENGLLKTDDQNGDIPMPADEVEAWVANMAEVVGQQAVEEFLGCSRSHFLTMLKARMIRPSYVSSASKRYRFRQADLQDLLTKLTEGAAPTPTTPDGFVGLDRVGKMAICSIATILKGVISGDFKGVAHRPGNRRIDGLEFDVQEAKRFARGEPLPGLPANELLAYWQMPYAALRSLISSGHLPTQRARHPIHRGMINVVPYEAIEEFETTYVHAQQLAEQMKVSRAELRTWLAANAIPLAYDPAVVDAPIYRRADIKF
ncbi:MAG: TniQ family protein [Phreatobacter sp.]|nr:TniQ family protein [Phreatobacter sp.]